MNTYLSKSIALTLFASALLFLSGCSKNTINIDLGGEAEGGSSASGGSSGTTGTNLVSFHASIESRNMTRSLSPMQKGIASLLFAYRTPIESIDNPTQEGLYVTSSVGVMSGANDYKMYLPTGVYTFYAVSNNSYSTPVQFVDGISYPLNNGTDYLWASNKLHDIASQQVSIPILYLHSATQVVFEISSAEGLKINKLVSATITPSKPGSRMTLLNGDINPVTEYASEPANMGVNGLRTQYIMLPLKTNVPMKLVLNVLVDDEVSPRTYRVNVPVPNNELVSGNSYLFSAILKGNTVSFSDVNIVNWTDVDETGNPLYPTSK